MATRTIAASITIGRFLSSPVRKRRQTPIVTEATTRDNGVFAPALSLTADWDKPPLTG